MTETGRLVEDFMVDFGRQLRGRGSWRRRIEAEMRDGLSCAVEEAGDADEARRVLRDWGSPGELAGEFNALDSTVRAGCLARRILVATPLIALGWAAVVLLSPVDPWSREPAFIWVCVRLLGLSKAVALVAATTILVGTRRSGLRRPPSPRAVLAAGLGTLAAECVGFAMLVYRASAAPGAVSWALAATPLTVSVILLALTTRDAYQLALRPGSSPG
jgi:hypothetical protein